jgi:hypothetical protein
MLQDVGARCSRPRARRRAPCRAPRTDPLPYQMLRQPTTRRSVRRGAARVEPPSWPSPCAPRAHAHRTGQPTASPPYARSAASGWLLVVAARTALAPCRNPLCDDSRDPLHKARAPIKEVTSPPCALPHTEPPLPPPAVLTLNSTSDCLSSQTRAAPNSTRVPSSSPFRVLLRPSR